MHWNASLVNLRLQICLSLHCGLWVQAKQSSKWLKVQSNASCEFYTVTVYCKLLTLQFVQCTSTQCSVHPTLAKASHHHVLQESTILSTITVVRNQSKHISLNISVQHQHQQYDQVCYARHFAAINDHKISTSNDTMYSTMKACATKATKTYQFFLATLHLWQYKLDNCNWDFTMSSTQRI